MLIVCEGEKTEPHYFKSLIAKLGLTTAEVEICGNCGSAPTSVVKYGNKKFSADPDYDLIFFVFDRDSHTDYDDALALIQSYRNQRKYGNKSFSAITSNPCFEVWFLMHFEPFTKPCAAGGGKSPCGNWISILKRKPGFQDYKKGQRQHFKLLSSRLHNAKSYAAQVLSQHQATGEPEHQGNPHTFVHKLVDTLEYMAKEQQREGSLPKLTLRKRISE